MAPPTKKVAAKKVTKKIVKKVTKPVVKKTKVPRKTKTIQQTVESAKHGQPSAGKRRLPRVNRRKSAAKAATAKKAAVAK